MLVPLPDQGRDPLPHRLEVAQPITDRPLEVVWGVEHLVVGRLPPELTPELLDRVQARAVAWQPEEL